MNSTILCIEGKYAGSPGFVAQLEEKGYQVVSFSTGKDALAELDTLQPKLAVVNAPTMRTTGLRICQSLRERMDGLPIILIATPEKAPAPEDACANAVLVLPFTIRKLNNRIRALLPLQSNRILKAGAIELDLEQHQVRIRRRKTHLTPRLTRLLEVLMRRAGEAIEREELFREVWSTDFTADTRTLDVHISWLRKALGDDPRKPKYLKTLRGVGYRLDV